MKFIANIRTLTILLSHVYYIVDLFQKKTKTNNKIFVKLLAKVIDSLLVLKTFIETLLASFLRSF